jgi:flagellin
MTMSNSINTNIAAYFAQANITKASNAAASSVARLSSGNAIVNASDNVAALAVGTSLATQVSALKTAQSNAAQGTSLLQVADGALSQIQSILQTQRSIALQAASGSLTNTDRGFLNQEFQALSDEINSLTSSTTFNGVNLIDGSLAQAAAVSSKTSQAATANATVTLSTNSNAGDTFVIGGLTLTAKSSPSSATDFQIGATAADTVNNLAAKLNALSLNPAYSQSVGQASYTANGNTLNVTARSGGSLGNNFTINVAGATNASVGGAYAGSTVNIFATGFTSSGASVAAATAAAETPFQAGDTITATVGTGTTQSLYTVVAGNSLTDIANGINANSTTTGITAAVVRDPSSSLYNIQLHSNNATGAIAINGGANFYNTTTQTHALNGATQTTTLFTTAFANSGLSGVSLTNATPSATQPFKIGDVISVSVGGGATQAITSALGTTETLATIVANINSNANAKTLGIHAAVDGSGKNVNLTYSDSTQAKGLSISSTNFFNTDATGATTSNGLNGSQSSITLFQTGFVDAGTTTVVGVTTAAPFVAGNTLTVTIPGVNGGAAINIGTVVAADKLQDIAKDINASAGAKTNGIHAEVVLDSNGLYNIKLSVASSAAASSIAFGPGAGFHGLATNANLTPPGNVNFSGSSQVSYNLFTNTLAAGFTAGASVTGAAASATTPFKNADTIVLTAANGATVTTAALATGDTLANIVTKINTAGNASGIYASLNSAGNNIVLNESGTYSNKVTAVSLGGNFYSADATGTNANNGTNTAYRSLQLFSTGFAAPTTVISGTTANASTPFTDGATIQLTIADINGAAATGYGTITAGSTLAGIASTINASANAALYGVHAQVITDSSGKANIQITAASQAGIAPNVPASITLGSSTAYFDYSTSPAGTPGTLTAANATTFTAATTSSGVLAAEGTGATHLATFGLTGGTNNGIGYGSTNVTGTIGDNLLTGLSQNAAKVTISFPDVAAADLTASGNFNSDGSVHLTVGGHNFAFTTTSATTKAPDEITIGATLQQTLDNAVSTINAYAANNATGNTAFQLNQITVSRSGNNLVLQGKDLSDVTQIDGTATSAIAITGFSNGAPVSNSGNLNNASRHGTGTFGIDTTGVSNQDFNGSVSGFTASYNSANSANVSVKVGNYTYTATGVNTNPTAANETVRFYSGTNSDGTNGGYFDVQLAQNNGVSVNSQADANTLATRFNAAFSGLNFGQERQIASYNGTQSIISGGQTIGSLVGSSVSADLPTFAANKLTNVTVTAPSAGSTDAKISLTIDGTQYVTGAGLGNQLGANQTFRLTSTSNPNNFVDFTTGNSSIDLSTADHATAVSAALGQAFGANAGAAALSFQIGASSTSTLAVSIGSAQTSSLFNGQVLDVSTQATASNASAVLGTAIDTVTSLRSSVGALESEFNFASAALQTSVQNQDAARGSLLDTDIANESTAYATEQVKLQAGISVLAQANQQLQALLKLIG